jgi:hypothetical protein
LLFRAAIGYVKKPIRTLRAQLCHKHSSKLKSFSTFQCTLGGDLEERPHRHSNKDNHRSDNKEASLETGRHLLSLLALLFIQDSLRYIENHRR